MEDMRYSRIEDKTFADRAIDGLFGGLIGGALMAAVLVLAGLFIHITPVEILEGFSHGRVTTPQAGVMMHLAVSAVYGVGFILLSTLIPRRFRQNVPPWLAGLAYGALLLVLAVNLILPGLNSSLENLPVWVLASGHAVYGVVLGLRAYSPA